MNQPYQIQTSGGNFTEVLNQLQAGYKPTAIVNLITQCLIFAFIELQSVENGLAVFLLN